MSAHQRSCRSRPLRDGGPGLAPVRNAGFAFHRGVPGSPGLTAAPRAFMLSRPTAGELEQVPGRVHVPVLGESAAFAAEGALGERQAWLSPDARRTGLGTGVPPASDEQR